MNTENKFFPQGFLWGAATAGHQVEGNNNNADAWLMEQLPSTMYNQPSGDACDFYHLYEQDILLLKLLGFNTLRFGIEWARVEPVEGQFSRAELNHYSRLVDACVAAGITPVITLHHFTSPRWLVSAGGWRSEATPEKFAYYARFVMEELGDRVKWVCTINEANTPLQLTMNGLFTGNLKAAIDASSAASAPYFGVSAEEFCPFFPNASDEKSVSNVFRAHQKAVEAIFRLDKTIKTGVTLSLQDIIEVEPSEDGHKFYEKVNLRFLREMGTVGSFVGVQNYTRIRFNRKGKIKDTENVSDAGVYLDPASLANTCALSQKITGNPVLVTEHGADFSDENDSRRVAFIGDSLSLLQNGIADSGLNVVGYIHWSLMDNFEWFKGYKGHYGLMGVNWETQERIPRPSAFYLGQIARRNHL